MEWTSNKLQSKWPLIHHLLLCHPPGIYTAHPEAWRNYILPLPSSTSLYKGVGAPRTFLMLPLTTLLTPLGIPLLGTTAFRASSHGDGANFAAASSSLDDLAVETRFARNQSQVYLRRRRQRGASSGAHGWVTWRGSRQRQPSGRDSWSLACCILGYRRKKWSRVQLLNKAKTGWRSKGVTPTIKFIKVLLIFMTPNKCIVKTYFIINLIVLIWHYKS